jgi:cyclopropane-fatty-acyl-phospholipid synthase
MNGGSQLDNLLLKALRKIVGRAPVRLVLGRSSEELSDSTVSLPTIRIADRATLLRLLANPEVGFGDSYSEGKVQIEGDFVRVLEMIYRSPSKAARIHRRLLATLGGWTRFNTLSGSKKNIHHHYDLGNDFYKLWLDNELAYTCAYFPSAEMTLEEAQRAKFDHVCRKLWLRPGETVIDAGCGWGGLALHMAKHYGVRVRAFNISHEQIAYARDRAKWEALADRVEFIEDDYRNINTRADVFCSVGMLEHVGLAHYREFGRVVHRVIGDTGRGLFHFIGRNYDQRLSLWIRKRIFPGGHPPALRSVMNIFEPQNYAVLDVENLRMHYARTLEHWLERFEGSYDTVVRMYDENFARMWRLYLAGSVAGFRVGTMQLFQVVFAGSACNTIPWTRAYLYDQNSQRSDEQWIRAIS